MEGTGQKNGGKVKLMTNQITECRKRQKHNVSARNFAEKVAERIVSEMSE